MQKLLSQELLPKPKDVMIILKRMLSRDSFQEMDGLIFLRNGQQKELEMFQQIEPLMDKKQCLRFKN